MSGSRQASFFSVPQYRTFFFFYLLPTPMGLARGNYPHCGHRYRVAVTKGSSHHQRLSADRAEVIFIMQCDVLRSTIPAFYGIYWSLGGTAS
ncbi:hypothetical protein F4677DRAFT_375571 [Hypoxylon crocopeplum]|nr:hypothetical protein F4677DRAFT_375571 [Hypoxylon crocopeplum]